MRKHAAIAALTLSSTLILFLALTYLGVMDGLFGEQGSDRASLVFIFGFSLTLRYCYLFWKRFGSDITRPSKRLVLTPLVGIIGSFTGRVTLSSLLMSAWFILLGWLSVQHGTWRALFFQKNTSV